MIFGRLLRRGWLRMQRWGLLRLRARSRAMRPELRQAEHLDVGERGELEALFFLRQQGFVVVERRWRSREERGDLDLVAWEGDALCVVEVKTRTQRDRSVAELSVDEDKKRVLRRLAAAYVRTQARVGRERLPVRFDVVSVYLDQVGADGEAQCELVRRAFAEWGGAV